MTPFPENRRPLARAAPSAPFFRKARVFACLLALLLCGCPGHSPSQPGNGADTVSLVGKWADLANAPGTIDKRCCFFDSTAAEPCGPDTLILRADGSMAFTSVPDEPFQYRVLGDTLYRFLGPNREDTLKYAFTHRGDTLSFAVTPLCDHNPIASRYRKVPE
ncbi:MAG TPA: hypothetical protein VJ385_01215 [Fibrobacteria bacterium]|nr:hypothetical protein [Fibrobacteria bacterium]